MLYKRRFVIAAASSALALAAQAQDTENEPLEQVVVTGTRVANRSALDTAAPVDVVSGEQLQNLGVTEINQALAVALPSFNFPRPGLADGTDTVRPATLRGLAPDQTLVLVNGKRRHAASLVNVNGTIGRGSSAVDLNTIPTAIVQSIEVLRDGASAQYGSDAIAGVVNLRLREAHEGGEALVSYGWRDSSYDTPTARRTIASRAPPDADVVRAADSAAQRFRRRDADGLDLERSAARRIRLPDHRRRVQGSGAHRARRLGRAARSIRCCRVTRSIRARRRSIASTPGTASRSSTQKTVFANAGYDVSRAGAHCTAGRAGRTATRTAPGFYRLADDRAAT